ncbi:MAG TPA: glycosyltransferase family 2 protein [Opitutaceae bacterium]|nr:glycosyltransferase family 2 protein [Opitutaceae bacterium]
MTASAPEISIVLPCLNEALTLATCLDEIAAALNAHGIDGEIVVADNGSTDGSQAIATAHGARLVPVAARGYGNALRGGFAAARGRYILTGDADGSYDFGHLPRFLDRLRAGADLVMGNRFAGGVQPGAMPWKNRYIGNPVLSFLGRLFFRTGIRDFHCGLRAFSAEAYRRMDLRTTGMEFASEMVIKAKLLGLRVEEVPTVLRPDGRDRPPHLRPWRDGWRHLRFMLLFSPRWLFLLPGLALMLAGTAAMALLLRGPLHLGGVVFDVHTLLFAAFAVLIGFQAVSFAVLGKFFAIRAGLRAPEKRFARLLDAASLEAGLIAGALLALVGFGISAGAVWLWGRGGFGDLTPQAMLRIVIPGALALTLGCQIALTSLFLGVLRLDTREERA